MQLVSFIKANTVTRIRQTNLTTGMFIFNDFKALSHEESQKKQYRLKNMYVCMNMYIDMYMHNELHVYMFNRILINTVCPKYT